MKNLPSSIFSGCWTTGHCQGIAVDTKREYIYYSFTTMLVKTDLQGNLIGTVTGLLGHLGCIDFCDEDGRLYGSLEYKNDAIGQWIRNHADSDIKPEDGFYIAIFDVNKIDRVGMDACSDGVMTAVFLKEVLDDYQAQVVCQGKPVPHRHGCSGIDGTTFGRIPGSSDDKKYLFVAYGVYSDVSRMDNDYQVILCYDTAHWNQYAQPLSQSAMHRSGPAAPLHKFFLFTGNTNWGIQNLEYDEATGNFLLAVYTGQKPQYPNYPMFVIDGSVAPRQEILSGVEPQMTGLCLSLLGEGYPFPYGSTGMCALGDGRFYVSLDGKNENGFYTHAGLYRWDGKQPLTRMEENAMKYQNILALSKEAYDFMVNFDPSKYEDGKYQLGNGVYVAISSYDSKLRKNGKYESHLKYIDVQYVISGQELICVEPVDVMRTHTCIAPYNEEKDVDFYVPNPDGIDHLMNPGDYLILLPEDGHMPGICVNGPSPIRKAVIKIPVKE